MNAPDSVISCSIKAVKAVVGSKVNQGSRVRGSEKEEEKGFARARMIYDS